MTYRSISVRADVYAVIESLAKEVYNKLSGQPYHKNHKCEVDPSKCIL